MDPVTGALLAGAVAGGSAGITGSIAGSTDKKNSRRNAKEVKRQTLTDMLNKALEREFELYKFTQEQGGLNSARRTAALQDTANGFSRALTGK